MSQPLIGSKIFESGSWYPPGHHRSELLRLYHDWRSSGVCTAFSCALPYFYCSIFGWLKILHFIMHWDTANLRSLSIVQHSRVASDLLYIKVRIFALQKLKRKSWSGHGDISQGLCVDGFGAHFWENQFLGGPRVHHPPLELNRVVTSWADNSQIMDWTRGTVMFCLCQAVPTTSI